MSDSPLPPAGPGNPVVDDDSSSDAASRHAADEGAARVEPLTIELLKHLSKEVEHVSTQLVAQRSKNNLLVAFAPYLILGILSTNRDLVSILRATPGAQMLTFSIVYVVLFGLLGLLAARIEKNFWDQGNFWRKLIVEVSGTQIPPERFLFSSQHLVLVYVVIYGVSALGLVFCLVVFRSGA